MSPTLLDALQRLAPQAAADCSRALAAGAVQQGAHRSAAAFTLAGRVRARAQTLDGACRDEASAEARSAAQELRFRTATELLVAAARRARATLDAALPGGPAPQRAVQILDEGLARWLDPYAADAAGSEPLDAWAARLQALPGHLHGAVAPVLDAMATARTAGDAWDAAHADRAAAIAHRVAAHQAWVAAVLALRAAVGDGDWLDPVHAARQQERALDTWFEDEEGDTGFEDEGGD